MLSVLVFGLGALFCIAGASGLLILAFMGRPIPLMIVALLLIAASLSGCSGQAQYTKDCEAATFTPAQCGFLWQKRKPSIGVTGPLVGGIIGINLP